MSSNQSNNISTENGSASLIGICNKHLSKPSLADLGKALSWSSSNTTDRDIPFTVPSMRRCALEEPLERHKSETRLNKVTNGSPLHLSQPLTTSSLGTASLGSLNPDLYKNPEEGDLSEYPDGHIGRLWFTIEFEKETEKLSVLVVKARNLPSRDLSGSNACDPFVRLFILPDERRYSESKVRRKTCNPNFGECFTFEISKSTLEERILKMVIFDIDTLKRYIPLGSLQYPLKDYVRCKKQKLTLWRDLMMNSAEIACQVGELHCSLRYNPTLERLTIVLVEAKDLRIPDDLTEIDAYAKVIFSIGPKQMKTKKTRILKKTSSPVFNESFDFKLPPPKLESACLTVQLMQVKPDRQIGRLTLAGPIFAKGKALDHWQEMLSKGKELVDDWHYLTE